MSRRLDIRAILAEPKSRERLFVRVIIATQAREGIDTSPEQALRAYRKARKTRAR